MSDDDCDEEYVPSLSSTPATPVGTSTSTAQKRDRSKSPSNDASLPSAAVSTKQPRMPEEEEDDVDPVVTAVAEGIVLQRATFDRWKAGVCGTLKSCVEAVNAFKREMGGVKPLHQKEVRDHVAYYECGCQEGSQCFKATFHRPKLKAGKKVRSSEWEIKSVSKRHECCEMQEPPAVAMANRFIPPEIKLILVMAFDQGLQPVVAFNNSQSVAAEQSIAVTWTTKDVQNLFTTLSQMIGEELIQVLRELRHAGHFVRVDLVKNAQGALVLNRFFVATRWMQEQYKLFGKVTLLDSSYGKNRELMPIQG
jgi:hypothetical protein